MSTIRGTIRLTILFTVLLIVGILMLLTAWIPIRRKGARITGWLATWFARFVMRLFNVRYTCAEPEKLTQHEGFVFPNHTSFLDIFMLLHLMPVRFVAKIEISTWPLIGALAKALDTVFVDRDDKESRSGVRDTLAGVSKYPPIILFPEGGIFSPPEKIHPFRYGAFEIAAKNGTPFLPCVMMYEPLDVLFWAKEPLMRALWRFACHGGKINARLFMMRSILPNPDDNPKELALETHGAMEAVLNHGNNADDIVHSGY